MPAGGEGGDRPAGEQCTDRDAAEMSFTKLLSTKPALASKMD